jgi:hypothetical protein
MIPQADSDLDRWRAGVLIALARSSFERVAASATRTAG